MAFFKIIQSLGFLVLVLSALSGFVSSIPQKGRTFLIHLGDVQGKDYYFESNQMGNWTEAKEFCNSNNLQLPTITTKEQNDFLIEASAKFDIQGYGFWTAGRDALTLSQFAWDQTGEALNATAVPGLYLGIEIKSCILWSSNEPNFFAEPCIGEWFYMCQTL